MRIDVGAHLGNRVAFGHWPSADHHSWQAERNLQRIADRARAAGVEYEADYALSDRPYDAIIRAAQKHGCDLIFMASHGRRGISALLHGSQTQAVIANARIPTLVYR